MTSDAFAALSQEQQIANLEILGRDALCQFGVEPLSLAPLVHAENTTFKVSSAQRIYNLRISRPGYQSFDNIRSEVAWLLELRQDGFRVPDPYGKRIVVAQASEVPEPRVCALFRWMDGEFRRDGGVQEAAMIGRAIARLHRFVRDWVPPPGFVRKPLHDWAVEPRRPMPYDAPNPMLSELDRELLQNVDRRARGLLNGLPRTPDRYGLIHADIHLNNAIFEGNELSLIDFDDSGYGFLYYDFAAALAYQGAKDAFPDIRDAMLNAYEEVRPLPPDTRTLLDPFLRLRLLGVCSWVLDRTDNPRMREKGPDWIAWMCGLIRLLGG